MKFILSSKVFGNSIATNKFRQFIRKPLSELKLLLIASHCLPYGPEKYYNELISNGFKKENIIIFDYQNINDYEDLDIDLIYATGGNTFTGLKIIKESGLDKLLKKYLNKGVIYLGRSAGSHFVTKNIEHILNYDLNEVGLDNYDALVFFDGILICHYSDDRKDILKKLIKENKYNVYTLTNEEILVIEDNNINKY